MKEDAAHALSPEATEAWLFVRAESVQDSEAKSQEGLQPHLWGRLTWVQTSTVGDSEE